MPPRPLLRSLFLAASLALGGCATTPPAGPAAATFRVPEAAPSPAVASIDSLLSATFPADHPGAAVLVARDGDVLLRKGYGMADLEMGVPVGPEHVFRIGSITKQFTGVGILMLAEEGKLALEDDIRMYLPDFPTHGRKITVEQLLTHTSGIRSYTGMPEWRPLMRKDLSVEELIDVFEGQPADFAPGEDWRYNNSGYVLLGAIIEKVSGQSYADFVRTRIFEPLGMEDSYYGDPTRVIPGRAEGYARGSEGAIRNAEFLSMTQPYAAGSLLSTVDDLYLWQRALEEGRVLKPETLRRAFAPARLPDGRSTGYGLGWFVSEAYGRPTVEHGGGINGFSTDLVRLPEEGISVVVLTNSEDPPVAPNEVSMRIVARLLGEPEQPPRIALSPEALEAYVGSYAVGERDYRVVTREGDRLYSRRTGGERYEIVPVGRDEFLFPESGTRLRFQRGPDGRVVSMRSVRRLGPEELPAPRTDEAPPPPPPVVAVAPEVLEAHAGEYELAPGFVLTIRREGAMLKAQATGQPEVTLLPESETRFNLQEVPAAVEFRRDATGRTTGLVLFQGGRELPAKRIR